MANHRLALGTWGQRQARDHLESKRHTILEENFRSAEGEIDIVAYHGDCLVLVEARTRSTRALGTPEESTTPQKQAQLVRVAQAYCQAHPDSLSDWRIDVVAVEGSGDGSPRRITLLPSAAEG